MRNLRKGESYAHSPTSNSKIKSLQPIVYGLLLIFVSMFSLSDAWAQSAETQAAERQTEIKPLKIGDTIPNELWNLPLQVVNHPDGKDTITLNDYRDKKLIILDFWATWCGTCIKAFPKMEHLSQNYGDDIYLFPITRQPSEKVHDFLQGRGKDFQKSFIYIVDASSAKSYFPHVYVPHIVVLYNGKVHRIETDGIMDEVWINEILTNQNL